MGFRFRKSVKICKGVKVNFSKSGASLSLGGRGHSVNIGKRSRATFGIPGTGLSYSTSLSGNHKKSSKGSSAGSRTSSSRASSVTVHAQIRVVMDDNGKIELRDSRDIPITDPSLIRKIKATNEYKNMVQNLEIQRQQSLTKAYNDSKEENERFIYIHRLSPQVDCLEQYNQVLNTLKPQCYVRKQYQIPYPNEIVIREQLTAEAKTIVTGSIFKVGKLRKEYVESHLHERLSAEISKWQLQKEQFEAEENRIAKIENEKNNAEYNERKEYLEGLINGDAEIINSCVESWISTCELPVEINVDYEWYQDTSIMYLDVDLPEIEDLPENELIRLASGNLKEKKKTQSTLKQEYVSLVFGLAIFISANIFNVSPAIHKIVISGYTQRRNKAGEIHDEYVYSIKFSRDFFEKSVLQNVSPIDFCMRFENRCNMTNTMLLRKISPYEIE